MPRLGLFGLLVGWKKGGTVNGHRTESYDEDDVSLADYADNVDAVPLTATNYSRNKSPPLPRPHPSTYQRPKSLVTTSSWDEAEPPSPFCNSHSSTFVPSTSGISSNSSVSEGVFPTKLLTRELSTVEISDCDLDCSLKGTSRRLPRDLYSKERLEDSIEYRVRNRKRRSERRRAPSVVENDNMSRTNKCAYQNQKRGNCKTRMINESDSNDDVSRKNNPFFIRKNNRSKPELQRRSTEHNLNNKINKNAKYAISSTELNKKVIPTYYVDSSSALPDPDHILSRLGHSLDSRLEDRHPVLSEPPSSVCVVWNLDDESPGNQRPASPKKESLSCNSGARLFRNSTTDGDFARESDHDNDDFLSSNDDNCISDISTFLTESYNQNENEAYNCLNESSVESERETLKVLEDSHRARLNRIGLAARSFTLLTLPEDDYEYESSLCVDESRERAPSPYPRKCKGFRSLPGTPVLSPVTSPTKRYPAGMDTVSPRNRHESASDKLKKTAINNERILFKKPPLSVYRPSSIDQYVDRSPSPSSVNNGILKYRQSSSCDLAKTRDFSVDSSSPSPLHEQRNFFFPENRNRPPFKKSNSSEILSPVRPLSSLSPSSENENGDRGNIANDAFNGRHKANVIPRRRRRRTNRLRDSAYFSTDENGENSAGFSNRANGRRNKLYRSQSAEAEISSLMVQEVIQKSLFENFNRLPEIIASEVNRQLAQRIPTSMASNIAAEVRDLTEKVEKDFSISQDNEEKYSSPVHKNYNETYYRPMSNEDEKYNPVHQKFSPVHRNASPVHQNVSRKYYQPTHAMSSEHLDTRFERSSTSNYNLNSGKKLSYSCQDLIDEELTVPASYKLSKHSTSISFADLGLTEPDPFEHYISKNISSNQTEVEDEVEESNVEVEGDLNELPTKHHLPLRDALKPLCRDLTKQLKRQNTAESLFPQDGKQKKSLVLKLKIDLDQMEGNQSDCSMEWDYYDQEKEQL